MYVQYGNFNFEPWEAGLKVYAEFVRSPRGFKHKQRVRYDISGELCVDTGQYDVNTRLQQIVNAFSVDGRDVGLRHDNGDATTHFLFNNIPQNLSGNQVYYKRFPDTRDGEFVSGRKFEIGVGAELLDFNSEILAYQDSITRRSNAGPVWRWRRNQTLGFYPELIVPNTMQRMVQSGYAIGATTYPSPPIPFYSPPFELNHLRQVRQVGPDRMPQGFTGFKTTWTYIYALPTFDDITRPTVV